MNLSKSKLQVPTVATATADNQLSLDLWTVWGKSFRMMMARAKSRSARPRQTKKGSDPIPHFAFWVTLKQPVNAKGKVVSTEVTGGAIVVYPELVGKPEEVTREHLVQRFIGRDKLQLAHAMYLDGEAWANEPPRNDFESEAVAMPEPRPAVNAPQPIADDENPF